MPARRHCKNKTLSVISLGGNAFVQPGQSNAFSRQLTTAREIARHVLPILKQQNRQIILTHGSGPQIGNILLQNLHSECIVEKLPLHVLTAMTQAQMSFILEQAFEAESVATNVKINLLAHLTKVEIDTTDKKLIMPNKPIGPFYNTEAEAKKVCKGYAVIVDSNRGWRLAVASPAPKQIHNLDFLISMLRRNIVLIACGGGGIPVVKTRAGALIGVNVVIDKDHTSALLAHSIDADELVILTTVEHACFNFGTSNEKPISNIDIGELENALKEGHFASGSMKPKIESVISFIKGRTKRTAIITNHLNIERALQGKTGTIIKS